MRKSPAFLALTLLGCAPPATSAPPCLANGPAKESTAVPAPVERKPEEPPVSPVAAPTDAIPPLPSAPTAFDVAAIEEYVGRQLSTRRFVGTSVAIVRDGKI